MYDCTLAAHLIWLVWTASLGATPSAHVSGRVVHGTQPLPNARVMAALPATDMRFLDTLNDPNVEVFETRSNERGEYELTLTLPGSSPVEASFDTRCKGYRSSAGTMRSGGDIIRRTIGPGDQITVNFSLPSAMYVDGCVVDDEGLPVGGVEMITTIHNSTSFG